MKKILVLAGLLAATGAFAQYDNAWDYSGFIWAPAGAGVDTLNAANITTRYACDDAIIDSKWYGKKVRFWLWQIYNANASAIQYRNRIRMHQANGTSPVGGPNTVITGYTGGLSILNANAGTWTGFYFDPAAASPFVVPTPTSAGTVWLGNAFDNGAGASAVTAAELNNVNFYMNNIPVTGTSTDKAWLATASMSGFTALNGLGGFFNFTGGDPVANLPISLWAGRDIQGTIDLQAWPSARYGEEYLTLEIYDSTDTLVDTEKVYLFADGTFETFTPITSGTGYSLKFKGRTWLSKKITGVDLSGDLVFDQTFPAYEPFDGVSTYGNPALPSIQMMNGDVDGDDVVSVFDYIALSDAFDSVADQDADPNTVDPSPNWLANADLDGDYAVSVFDYIILSDNFDMAGDTVP